MSGSVTITTEVDVNVYEVLVNGEDVDYKVEADRDGDLRIGVDYTEDQAKDFLVDLGYKVELL